MSTRWVTKFWRYKIYGNIASGAIIIVYENWKIGSRPVWMSLYTNETLHDINVSEIEKQYKIWRTSEMRKNSLLLRLTNIHFLTKIFGLLQGFHLEFSTQLSLFICNKSKTEFVVIHAGHEISSDI